MIYYYTTTKYLPNSPQFAANCSTNSQLNYLIFPYNCSPISDFCRQLCEQWRAVDVSLHLANPANSLQQLVGGKTATLWEFGVKCQGILNISKTSRECSVNTVNVWRERRTFGGGGDLGMFAEFLGNFTNLAFVNVAK